MPFDLPPPPTPQLVETEQIQDKIDRAGQDIVLDAEHLSLRIIGNSHLSEERVLEVTGPGRTASQKIQLLNALYQEEGYPLVNIHYAREGDTVYVLVHEGELAAVDAPDLLRPFFVPLIGEPSLRRAQLQRRQVLAEIKARRAGLDVDASYTFADDRDPGDFTLSLASERDPEHSRWNLTAGLGNPGNRFIGRHFGTAQLMYATPWADRLGVSYTGGITSLDGNGSDQDFDQFEGKYDTVNRFGLYGLKLGRTDYTASDFIAFFPGTDNAARFERADARIDRAEVTGGQLLRAVGSERLVIEQSLEYVDSAIFAARSEDDNEDDSVIDNTPIGAIVDAIAPGNGEDNGNSTRSQVQDERYFAARLGGRYSRSIRLWDRQTRLAADFGLKAGLSDDSGTLDGDAEGPIRRTARFQLFDAEVEVGYPLPADFLLTARLELQRALRDRQVPQQQQWVLGGPDRLSAFLPGTLVGDSGSYARLQLQLPRGRLLGIPYRFSPFVELGRASFNDAEGDADRTRSASGYGVKLEASLLEAISLTLHLSDDISSSNVSEEFLRRNSTTAFFRIRGRW